MKRSTPLASYSLLSISPQYREAEIKHCRIAMLAVLGWVVADFVHLPGKYEQHVGGLKEKATFIPCTAF